MIFLLSSFKGSVTLETKQETVFSCYDPIMVNHLHLFITNLMMLNYYLIITHR